MVIWDLATDEPVEASTCVFTISRGQGPNSALLLAELEVYE